MSHSAQIVFLRVAIAACTVALVISGGVAWRLASIRSRLQTEISNLQANEQSRHTP